MMNRKGQVKFGETIGIIFIVYIVIVMGFVWYNNSNQKDIKDNIEEDRKNQAFEKYHYIVKLNLIHRSDLGDIEEEFDYASVKSLKLFSETQDGKEYLRERLGDSQVTFNLYDINLDSIENITVYNRTPSKEKFNIEVFKTVVPVVDGINNEQYIGVLEIRDFLVR